MPEGPDTNRPFDALRPYESYARRVFASLVSYKTAYIRGFMTTLNQLVLAHLREKGGDEAAEQASAPAVGTLGAEAARLRTETMKLRALLEARQEEVLALRTRLLDARETIERLEAARPAGRSPEGRGADAGVRGPAAGGVERSRQNRVPTGPAAPPAAEPEGRSPAPDPLTAPERLSGEIAPQASSPARQYLPAPQKDGSFDEARLSPAMKQGISIFTVTADPASGLLEFRILEDPDTMKKVLGHPAGYLEPVSDAENALTPSTRMAVVTAPGRLVRQGAKLVLKERMRIRYE